MVLDMEVVKMADIVLDIEDDKMADMLVDMVDLGRVEKSKNGIQSCPKCFLGVFWYKLTGIFFFWSTKIFSWVEFHLKIWDLGLFSDFCTFFSTGKKLNSY